MKIAFRFAARSDVGVRRSKMMIPATGAGILPWLPTAWAGTWAVTSRPPQLYLT